MDILFKILKYTLMIAPAILGFHAWLYSKYPKYYFFFVRLFSKWRDTTWSINIDYKFNEIENVYPKMESVLKRKFKSGKFKRSINMRNKKLYECGVFSILVQDDFDDGDLSEQKILIKIHQLNVTLNTAEERLRELRELFNEIQNEIKPVSQGYNLDVYFKDGNNPFYGLMVQRLGKSNVVHFECFFPINSIVSKQSEIDTNQHLLRVFKEKLCINESSFDIVEETAKRALLFK